MASYKYLICVISQKDYAHISENIEKISKRWWRIFGINSSMAWLISTDKKYDSANLRDAICGEYSASIFVMGIETKNTAAASGEFGIEKNWNWVKSYVKTDDQENNSSSPIPNAAMKRK